MSKFLNKLKSFADEYHNESYASFSAIAYELMDESIVEIERLTTEVKSAFDAGYIAGASSMSYSGRGDDITEESAWNDFVSNSKCNHIWTTDTIGPTKCGLRADEE